MNKDTDEQDRLLGFVALYATPAGDGYLGAILVTDFQGVPREFRCTHPIKPTTIQKPLYGDALEPYIGVNLCGIPLIESIQNKPSVIIVNKEFLLDVRAGSPCPVIYIRRAGEAIEIKEPDTRERIDSATGRFQPIVYWVHPDFHGDKTSAREMLEKTFSHLDPLEPFDRMGKAVEILGKQDKRFQ